MYLNILLLNKILLHYNLSHFSSFLFQFITNIYNHTQIANLLYINLTGNIQSSL